MQLLADFAPERQQEGPGTRSHPRRPPWLASLSSLLGMWCFLLPKEQSKGSGEEWETKQGQFLRVGLAWQPRWRGAGPSPQAMSPIHLHRLMVTEGPSTASGRGDLWM